MRSHRRDFGLENYRRIANAIGAGPKDRDGKKGKKVVVNFLKAMKARGLRPLTILSKTTTMAITRRT